MMRPSRTAARRVLFVRNLPFNISAEEMYEIFGKFGAIRQIRQVRFPLTFLTGAGMSG